MKVNDIFNETTTSGSIASVSVPMSIQKRNKVGTGVYDNTKFGNLLTGKISKKKYANSLKEYTGETFRVQVTTNNGEVFTYSVKADNREQALKKVWQRANKSGYGDFQLKILEENIIAEGKVKELSKDIKNRSNNNMKKKYMKSKEQIKFNLKAPKQKTNESTEQVTIMYDRDSLFNDITGVMKDTVAKFKHYASSKTFTVPSAPDTSKFLAVKDSMIDIQRKVPAGPVCEYDIFLRIGAALPLELRRKIKEYFLERLGNNIGIDLPRVFITNDGYEMMFSEKNGTSWGGFGYITLGKVKKSNETKPDEEDKIISPGKGKKLKTGLYKPGQKKKLSYFKHPFKSSGVHVSDSRGNKVCECENEDIAKEVAKALNKYVKIDENIKRVGAYNTKGGILKLLKSERDPMQYFLVNPKGEVVRQFRGTEDEVKKQVQQDIKSTIIHENKRKK